MVVVGGHVKWRGGNPIPFPNFGSPPVGFPYLPQHGFLRDTLPWSLHRSDDGVYSQHLFSEQGVQRRCPWPWKFTVEVCIKVGDHRLEQVVITRNRHTAMHMPLGIAFHPYFCTPRGEATVTLGDRSHQIGGGKYESGIVDASRHVTVSIPGLGAVKMLLSDLFAEEGAKVLIWTDSTQYLCVEPIVAHPQHFGKPGGISIPPGGTKVVSCTFRFIPEE
jgi:galactose mutarotase-like enzyme